MRFVLHAGFHKTAATHIQRALLSESDWLKTKSVLIVPHSDGKKAILEDGSNGGSSDAFWKKVDYESADRVIVSDETALGNLGNVVFTGDLHRSPKRPLENFTKKIPVDPTDILISVRDYQTFFSSAYVEMLPTMSNDRFAMPDIVAAKVNGSMPNWTRIIDAFADKFPKARIVVWRYEDFLPLYSRIFTEFLGKEVAEKYASRPSILRPLTRVNETPTDPMVQKFFEALTLGGLPHAQKVWPEILETQIEGRPFALWTDAQAKHLAQMYEDDWATLCDNPHYTTLQI